MFKARIKKDLKRALREGEKGMVETLRLLLSEIVNREKEKRRRLSEKEDLSPSELKKRSGLTEEEGWEVVSSEVKKRKEAIEEFKKGGREDLVEREEEEREILEDYLPPQMSGEELEEIVEEVVEETGARGLEQMGEVMGKMRKRVKSRASGERVAEAVRRALVS